MHYHTEKLTHLLLRGQTSHIPRCCFYPHHTARAAVSPGVLICWQTPCLPDLFGEIHAGSVVPICFQFLQISQLLAKYHIWFKLHELHASLAYMILLYAIIFTHAMDRTHYPTIYFPASGFLFFKTFIQIHEIANLLEQLLKLHVPLSLYTSDFQFFHVYENHTVASASGRCTSPDALPFKCVYCCVANIRRKLHLLSSSLTTFG